MRTARRAVTVAMLVLATGAGGAGTPPGHVPRVDAVVQIPGCVAFWDFMQREPGPAGRFTAHVPAGATNDFALDAGNYVRDFWGEGREAAYEDFPLLGRGPFGQAVRIRQETDPTFRPFLFVPRARLHGSPLDIKGSNRSVTVVAWAIRESGNHALAGIWHEGTDLQQKETTHLARAVRGQRQYALFAGLNQEGSACGHVSENGAGSFLCRYALHKANSAGISPAVPADSPADALDASWQCFAMTFDHRRQEITGWLDGRAGDRWLEDPQKDGLLSFAANAWRQGHLRREPGRQAGEDPDFPPDQLYSPPEDAPVAVRVIGESPDGRVEVREYPYTKVKVTVCDGRDAARELVALRLNPWWYPRGIYAPPDDGSGGPFTIGRVIHSARGVGFTGWIGGVAVFDRALAADELQRLAALGRAPLEASPLFRIDARTPEGLRTLFAPAGGALPVVSAHRGGPLPGLPENSLAAFEHTLRHTFAVMEVDPRVTKDGHLVLHHDPTLERTTTGAGAVSSRTLAELKQLRLKDPDGKVTAETIPTLDEALEWARGKTVLILDRKDVPVEERVRKIVEHRAEAHAMVIVYSFKEAQACHALNPDIMMEVMIPDAARVAEFDRTGVPWSHVLAFVGHAAPADPAVFDLLRRRGACAVVGTSRNLDRRLLAAPPESRGEAEAAYRALLAQGAGLLETDLPARVGPLLHAATPIPAAAAPLLHRPEAAGP